MVPVFWSTTNTRSVIQPQETPFRLLLRYFQPLATPDARHTFVIDLPAFPDQKAVQFAIAITAIFIGQFLQTFCEFKCFA